MDAKVRDARGENVTGAREPLAGTPTTGPTATWAMPSESKTSSRTPGEHTVTERPREASSLAIARTWVWTPPGTLSA